jgi:hypothetical protein
MGNIAIRGVPLTTPNDAVHFDRPSSELQHRVIDEDGVALPPTLGEPPAANPTASIPKALTIRLYTSHFLSAWNSRWFEAAAVYFLASIFPQTLLLISVYALARNAAAIALTVPVGRWIDRADRLAIVRTSIIGQRVAVAISCVLLWALLSQPLSNSVQNAVFAGSVLCACVEKLAASANLVAIERDWVVIVTEGNEDARRMMNARMRRIDLFCKLLGPLAVAMVATASVEAAIWLTLGMNMASLAVEYFCIETVGGFFLPDPGQCAEDVAGLQTCSGASAIYRRIGSGSAKAASESGTAAHRARNTPISATSPQADSLVSFDASYPPPLFHPPSRDPLVLLVAPLPDSPLFLRPDADLPPRL